MGRGSAFLLTAVLVAATMLLAPAQGAASQVIGSDLSGNAANESCGTDTSICTESFRSVPNPPSFGDATSDGVITAWAVRENGSGSPEYVALRVLRFSAATTALGVATAAPAVFPAVTGDRTVTFSTRLPIAAGDRIGFDHSTALHTCLKGNMFGQARWNPPLADGEQADERGTGLAGGACETPVQAAVEPDVDHDGYGDETQDQCPTDASVQGPCPVTSAPAATVATATATGQQAAALKKCKKKHSKHARRKCRKKARSLPV
jgi:hypothetical protein